MRTTASCKAMNEVYDKLRSLTAEQLDRFEEIVDLKPLWPGYSLLKYQIFYTRHRWPAS